MPRVLEFVVCFGVECLIMNRSPVLWQTLSPFWAVVLLSEDIDAFDVLLNLVRTVIKVIIAIIEDLEDFAIGPRLLPILFQGPDLEVSSFR